MSLFQSSVLKKYLASQNSTAVQAAYASFCAYFHNPHIRANIRAAKEEQFQEGFLRELFVNILGYTINPEQDYNLTTELKNIKDAKKTDGAILKDGSALPVIELKGTGTKDLEKLTTKLQNWPSLDFKGFLGELKKAKVKLSLSEEAEWITYFNEQKAKAQELQSEINRMDQEIDGLVYELYGLTEEEIRVVEGGEG